MDTGVTIKLEKPTNRGYILDWKIDLDLALTYSVKLPDRNEWELGEPAYLAKGNLVHKRLQEDHCYRDRNILGKTNMGGTCYLCFPSRSSFFD